MPARTAAPRGVGQFLPTISAETGPPPVDREIAALAARQHGVVSRGQLRDLGLADSAIGYRVSSGRLHRVHRGVFAVGHRRLPSLGAWSAAGLPRGPRAVLSHAAAPPLWDMRPSAASSVGVTIPPARPLTPPRIPP